MRQLKLPLVVALYVSIWSCDNRPAPKSVHQARIAIREAELSKAQELAAMELFAAREKLERAEKLLEDSPNQAWRYAEESQVDAELALAKAKKVATEQSYESFRQGIDSVYGA